MTEQLNRKRALLGGLVGIIAIGGAFSAFVYYDQPQEPRLRVVGTVTNTWRERGGFVYCQIRLADGVVLNEQCDSYPIGTTVAVSKARRAISGRAAYSVIGRSQ